MKYTKLKKINIINKLTIFLPDKISKKVKIRYVDHHLSHISSLSTHQNLKKQVYQLMDLEIL